MSESEYKEQQLERVSLKILDRLLLQGRLAPEDAVRKSIELGKQFIKELNEANTSRIPTGHKESAKDSIQDT